MREQVELTFLIGTDSTATEKDTAFGDRVIEIACELCGGCAVISTTGYWMSDGASHAETFSGKLQQEDTLHIKLTCELSKEHHVYEIMRYYISYWAYLLEIDTTWVHVQRTPFTGMHFSTKETMEEIYRRASRESVSPVSELTREEMSRSIYRDIVSPGTRFAHE